MEKKGVSAVVAIILMILITVAGVVIIWSVIVPLIKNNISIADLDGDLSIVTSEGYTAYDSVSEVAIVQIKRGTDDSIINKAEIIFTIGGDAYKTIVDAPTSNQAITYSFNFTGLDAPDSVSVAPVFVVGNQEKTGPITSRVDLRPGTIVNPPAAEDLLEVGTDSSTPPEPDCVDEVDCDEPGVCERQAGALCTDGSCVYGPKTDGTVCDDGNANTENDVCTTGVCAGTLIVPETCSDGIQNQGETGIDCGGPCSACSVACTDGDNDGYCLEASGSCDATSMCANGYDDCNDANINEYIIYPADTYYLDTDGDGYGTTLLGAFCSDTAHAGAVSLSGDCGATNPAVNPGATESAAEGNTCDDGLNNDCDAFIDCEEVTDCGSYVTCSRTALTSCGTPITTSGEYYMVEGDWSTGGADCFTITADDVHIDGNGEYLSVGAGNRGFFLDGASFSDMVTGFELSNLVFEIDTDSPGVYAEYAADFNIHHNNFTFIPGSTSNFGIRLRYSDEGLIYGNRFINLGTTGTSRGVYLYYSDNNLLAFNFFSKVYYSFYINVAESNDFNDNIINDTLQDGLYIYGLDNIFRRNSICDSVLNDVNTFSSTYCTYSTFPTAGSGDGNTCSVSDCEKACAFAC